MDDVKMDLDEQQRRGLQEYIFDLEEIKERAEELSLAHEKLKGTQDLLVSVLSCTPHGLCLIKGSNIIWCNNALAEIFGWEHDKLMGENCRVLCPHLPEYEASSKIIDMALDRGDPISGEYFLVHKSGHHIPCLVIGRALDVGDLSKGYFVSVTDFSERYRSEKALKEAYDELEKSSRELMRVNEKLNLEIDERKRAEEELQSYRENLEEQVKARTKELRNQISIRREAEEALRKSENEYRAIFENTGSAAVIIEPDGTIALANAEFEKLSGFLRTEIEGKIKWSEFVSPDDFNKTIESYDWNTHVNSMPQQHEFRFMDRSGNIKHVFHTTASIPGTGRTVASLLDVTVQKAMEAEAFKAHKLESVGVLAGGIAHDFNNILTAIVGNVALAKMSSKGEGKILQKLEEIEKACFMAQGLTQQLLTFSKGGEPVKKTMKVSELIRNASAFPLRGSNVKLEFAIAYDLWPVDIDEGQISQVIANLVLNADQAMPLGGVVRVEAENVTLWPASMLSLPPGQYVKVSVSDQGAGMAEEQLAKIFDPFFSTKKAGNGLGLAIVYSIVKRHGGHVTVESKEEVGSTFSFYLPSSSEPATAVPETDQEFLSGKGKILLMDDDELILDMLSEMIEELGYEPSCARDGLEAVKAYVEAMDMGAPYDIVLMDLTIPGGMGGKEAIRRLRTIDPEITAIVSSGYSNDPIMAEYREHGFAGVISKPYRMEDLARILHCLVNRKLTRFQP